MSGKKGFTLIEIVVVLVIIGILAAVAVPYYSTMVEQGAARAAQNNLISIYNAQKSYYFSTTGNGTYCTAACNSLANINTTLSLNISDSNFGYQCTAVSGFTCTATNVSNGNLSLAVTNNPIVLPGGSGTLNPSCSSTNNPSYCPS